MFVLQDSNVRGTNERVRHEQNQIIEFSGQLSKEKVQMEIAAAVKNIN
jgi:hypothetical protein